MIKKIIFPLCYLILSIALTACGGGGGSSGAASSESVSQTIAGTALDATGKPFVKGTDVLAVDSNGNVAGGKVKDDLGNFELTLTSIASSGKRFKGFGNVVLKVGGGSNSLTIVVPTADGKGTIEINVNLIVSEASKQFLNDLDLEGLFDKVETAVAKGGALGDSDLGSLDAIQKPITEAFLADSVKDLVLALLGPGASGIDFLSGSIKTTETPFLQEAFTASKTITSLITTSIVGTGGSISPSATVLFNANATISIIPDAGFEVSELLVDNVAKPTAMTYDFNNVIENHTISATFKKKTYTITNTSDANGIISDSSVVVHGSDVTVVIAAATNFEISTLTVDGKLVTPSASVTFSSVTENHTVHVTFKIVSYSITTAVVGGNGTISASASVDHGATGTITITPSAGFGIDKLTVDNEVVVAPTETVVFTNVIKTHTVSVTFKATIFNITTTTSAGGIISASTTAVPGANVTVTMTPSAGFLISELKVDGVIVPSASTYTITAIAKNYTVSVTYIAGKTISTSAAAGGKISASSTVLSGSDVTVTITPDVGFLIKDLTVDGTVVLPAVKTYTFKSIIIDHLISVTFIASNIITASSDQFGTISPVGAVEVATGANQTFTMTPNIGYIIDQVKINNVIFPIASPYTFTAVTSAQSISVTYKLIGFVLGTSVSGGGGSISASSTPAFGTNAVVTMTPNPTYVVSSITVDGVLFDAYPFTEFAFSNITANHNISATFAPGKIITATAGPGGVISPSGSIGVVLNANRTFNMTPNTGFEFDMLTVDVSATGGIPAYTFSNVTATHTINATFKIKKYNVTTYVNDVGTGDGIISPSVTAVNHFSDVVITLTPDVGSIVGSLYVDGSPKIPVLIVDNDPESTPVYTYTFKSLDAHHNVEVIYEQGFIISASAQANGSVTPEGFGAYLAGTNPAFLIEADIGYAIEYVNVNGAVDGSNFSYYYNQTSFNYEIFNLSEAYTIDVSFAIQQFQIDSISFNSDQGFVDGFGSVDYGANKLIKITPRSGYLIDYVEYEDDNEDYTYITITDPTSVSVSFTNIQSNYEFTIYFKKDTRFEKNNILTLGAPASTTDFTVIKDYIGIAAGYDHSLGLKSNGSVIAWGGYQNGQVGTALLSNIKAISAGYEHTLALDNTNVVHEIGNNTGLPNNLNNNISAIAAGYYHNLALRSGEVIAWGTDYSGELTVPVAAQTGVTAIAAGEYYSMALNNGEVIAWGETEYNQTIIPVEALTGVTAIAAGRYHAVALKIDGSVVAWGDNSYGETTTLSLTNVKAIAAGEYFTVALKMDGTVTVLGSSYYSAPQGLKDVIAISASYKHILALKSDGSIVAWGYNNQPQNVSINTQIGNYGDPTKIPSLKVKSIVNGDAHIVALLDNGMVKASGGNLLGQTDIPVGLNGVSKIAAGENHTLALNANGEVVAWGSNSANQSTLPLILTSVKAISAGKNHSVALTTEGIVFAWGANGSSQSTVPNGLANVIDVAAGWNHTVALKSDGTVVAWGLNNRGQTTIPPAAVGIIAIAAGEGHSVGLKSDGTLVVWGDNSAHQLDIPLIAPRIQLDNIGFGNQTNTPSLVPLNGIISIAAGGNHTVALLDDGRVFAWGENDNGQSTIPSVLPPVKSISAGYDSTQLIFGGDIKGVATDSDYPYILKANGEWTTPNSNSSYDIVKKIFGNSMDAFGLMSNGSLSFYSEELPSEGNDAIKDMAAGNSHAIALKDNGTLIGWMSSSPQVPDFSQAVTTGIVNAIAVSAGWTYSNALKADGTVTSWGESAFTNVPAGTNNLISISTLGKHTVALKGDGTVVMWGGSGPEFNIPVGLTNVIAVAAGGYHSLALKSDGTVVEWGRPGVAPESIGNTINSDSLPIGMPASLSGVVAISAGEYFSIALKSDGTIVMWLSQYQAQ